MADLSEAERMELVALELIRRAIVDLPTAIARNMSSRSGSSSSTGGGKPAATTSEGVGGIGAALVASKSLSGLAAVAVTLGAKFAAILGPMAAFAAILSAETGGFQIVGSAMKVLAATIAPILLPVMVTLAATLVALSDVVKSHLIPVLGVWNSFVFGQIIPAAIALVGIFDKLLKAITWVVNKIPGTSGGAAGGAATGKGLAESLITAGPRLVTSHLRTIDSALEKFGKGEIFGGLKEGLFGVTARFAASGRPGAAAVLGEPGKSAEPGKPADPTAVFARAMDDTLRELQLSMGPKASNMGVSGVASAARLAALNQSPFEARMLETMKQVLEEMRKVAAHTAPEGKAAY